MAESLKLLPVYVSEANIDFRGGISGEIFNLREPEP